MAPEPPAPDAHPDRPPRALLRPPVRFGPRGHAGARLEREATPEEDSRDAGSDQSTDGTREAAAPRTWEVPAIVALVGAMVLFTLGDFVGDQPSLPGVFVLPLLLLLVWPLIRRARRSEHRFDLAGLLLLSFGLHMIGAYFRLVGASDALQYQTAGLRLSESFRAFDFTVVAGRPVPGTGSLYYFTGLVHTVTNSSLFPTFLVFATLAFLGLYCFYRAFETGLPDGDHRRYALLIFLWPSLLFWPSSIGKESVMVLTIGLASWGAARLFQHERGGLTVVVLGLAGTAMVRPHVALMLMIAAFVALLFRRSAHEAIYRTATKMLAVAILLVGGSILATETADYLDLENLGNESVGTAFDETQEQTTQGGSSFSPARVRTPFHYPWAAVTVLFRPFPFEAHTTEAFVSSLEAVGLLALIIVSWGRLKTIPRLALRTPYLTYAIAFVLVFVFAFSVIGNFGILVRQRAQVLPFVFVMLALPPAARTLTGRKRHAADTEAAGS